MNMSGYFPWVCELVNKRWGPGYRYLMARGSKGIYWTPGSEIDRAIRFTDIGKSAMEAEFRAWPYGEVKFTRVAT